MIENGRFGVSYKIENKRKKNIVTYVIAFDPFQILTYWALQNDSQFCESY